MVSVRMRRCKFCNVFIKFCSVLSSTGWRTPPCPRHQMEALLVLWAGPVISCQRSGVNQGLSQQERPQLSYHHHLLLFLYGPSLFTPLHSASKKNTHFSSFLSFFSFSLFFCPPYCTLALFSLWQNLDRGGYKSWSMLSMYPTAGPANT